MTYIARPHGLGALTSLVTLTKQQATSTPFGVVGAPPIQKPGYTWVWNDATKKTGYWRRQTAEEKAKGIWVVIAKTGSTSQVVPKSTVQTGVVPPSPGPDFIWVWTDAARTKGYWKRRTTEERAQPTKVAVVAKPGSTLVPRTITSSSCPTGERMLLGKCVPSYLSQSVKCVDRNSYLDTRSDKCVSYVPPSMVKPAPKDPDAGVTQGTSAAPSTPISPTVISAAPVVRPAGGPSAVVNRVDADTAAQEEYDNLETAATTPKQTNWLLIGALGAGAIGALWYFTRK